MVLALKDIISFEVGTLSSLLAVVEGVSKTTGATIVTSPAPFPTTEVNCLQLTQSSSFNIWNGKVYAFTAGDAFLVTWYMRFTKNAGIPFVNDIPFLTLYDGTNDHLTLALVENGGVNDLEIRDAVGAVCATISGSFIAADAWYLGKMLVKLQDADTPSGGTGGECELEILLADTSVAVGSASCANENFKTGVNTVGVRLKSEGGITPVNPTTTFIGSALLFSGVSTPLDVEELARPQLGHFTCIAARPTLDSATPEVDSAGNTAGLQDLDNGTKWKDAGDLAHGVGNRCQYDNENDDGGVSVAHPGSDSDVTSGATQYGGAWWWQLSFIGAAGNADVFYGKVDSTPTYTLTTDTGVGGGLARAHKVVEDVGGSNVPGVADDAVIGFINDSTGADTLYLDEAAFVGAYAYPLELRAISMGSVSGHRGGRVVVG